MKSVAIGLGLMLAMLSVAAAQHAPVEKTAKQTSAEQLHQTLDKHAKVLVIDVRNAQEFATGHVPGAVNIPLEDLAAKLREMKVPKDTTLVTVCEHGGRSSRAALELAKMGYATASYCTLDSWKKCGYKVATGDAKPRAALNAYNSVG